MISKKIVILVLISFFILLNELSIDQKEIFTGTKKNIKSFNNSKIEEIFILNTNSNTNKYWSLKEVKKIKEIKKEKSLVLNITQKGNTICISKSCYKLVGIFKKEDKYFVTLYCKDKKKRLKDYTSGEVIENNIKIGSISSKEVELVSFTDSKKWYFKIFNVEAQKYKPKKEKNEK